jgi:hypothetical protein
MRNRSCIDSIDDYKSAVDLSIYRGGGLDPLPSKLRANPGIFVNKRSEKLGTLICSERARTVRPTGADRPASGPDCPHLNLVLNTPQTKRGLRYVSCSVGTREIKIRLPMSVGSCVSILSICVRGALSRLRSRQSCYVLFV